jgi:chitodextrinase
MVSGNTLDKTSALTGIFNNPSSRDYTLVSNSPVIDKGVNLTTVTSATGSGTTFNVADSHYFCDGWNLITADTIQVGSQTCQIGSINYSTNTITCTAPISWVNGAGVNLPYSGSAPDPGAYEYVQTGGDTTPPTVSISAPTNGATVSGSITVSANASDNVAVAGVQFKLDGANLGSEVTASPYSISWNTTGTVNGSHTLTAVARDTSNNQTTSGSVSVTVNNASDTQAPTIPANLSATAVSSSQINLTWTASTDNVGVTGYRIYRGGTQINTSATNSYSDTGLSPSTNYSYTVAAYDAAGNVSAQSTSASATTQAGGSGPVGWWKFDETSGTTASDSSGNNNTGTLVNGPVWTTGKIGGALSFDGVDDYVDAGTSNTFDLSASPFSVSIWTKVHTFSTSGAANRIVIKRTNSNTAWQLNADGPNDNASYPNTFSFVVQNNGTAVAVVGNGSNLLIDTWYHVVGVSNGSGTLAIYVNGVLLPTATNANSYNIGTLNNLYIGARTDGGTHFNGLIDDVRIYNRALSAGEVQALYNAGTDTTPPAPPSGVTVS